MMALCAHVLVALPALAALPRSALATAAGVRAPRHGRGGACRMAADEADSAELSRQRRALLNSLFREAPVETSRCAHQFPSLPLWRVQWASLPAHNELLNVHVPHYTHMFTELMAGPRPWLYGAFHLEDGSRNLGSAEHALRSGEVGVLCEVVAAHTYDDGRLLLATRAVGRVAVEGVTAATPYTRADCTYYADDEELELYDDMANEAAAQHAPDCPEAQALDSAVTNATLAAAAAAACGWAALERALEPSPVGFNPFGELELGSAEEVERVAAAVCELAANAANAAARRALGLADEEAPAGGGGALGAAPLDDDDEEEYDDVGEDGWREGEGEGAGCVSLVGLERLVWNELLLGWSLAAQLKGDAMGALPPQLVALMPAPPPGGWDQPPLGADGRPVSPPCLLPGGVRRWRASFLLSAVLPELVETAEQRLELLHMRDVRSRLLLLLHELEKQRKLLAAVLALRGVTPPRREGGEPDAPSSGAG